MLEKIHSDELTFCKFHLTTVSATDSKNKDYAKSHNGEFVELVRENKLV